MAYHLYAYQNPVDRCFAPPHSSLDFAPCSSRARFIFRSSMASLDKWALDNFVGEGGNVTEFYDISPVEQRDVICTSLRSEIYKTFGTILGSGEPSEDGWSEATAVHRLLI